MNRSEQDAGSLLVALGADDGAGAVRLGTALMAAVISAAIGHRLLLAFGTSFPITDGALFYDFVRAIAETFPRLPAHVRYNGIDIPFAYPPLSFWLAAGLAQIGVNPLQIIHYAPIAMNGLYVLLFGWLLIRHGHSRLLTALALLFTFTALRSFEWLVMGGGLSRSFGSIFMLLSLIAVGLPPAWSERAVDGPGRLRLILSGLCIGIAILSHLEWGILATACFITSRALGARTVIRFVLDNVVAGAVALAVVLPWAGLVIGTHGLEPFFAAGGSSDWSLRISVLKVLGTFLSNAANLFMLLGLAIMVARRDWFWPIFVLLCMLLTPRQGDTPAPLAIGIMSAHGVLAFFQLLKRIDLTPGKAAATTALLVGLIVGWQVERDHEMARLSRPLSPARLAAMDWVRERHGSRTYAVVTRNFWAYDASAEWLPTLTGARSINTVQGREWLSDKSYQRFYNLSVASLQAKTCDALLRTIGDMGTADFIWVERKPECFHLPTFRPIYRNADVTIFAVDRRAAVTIASAR